MQLSKFIEGLTILRPHYNDQDGYHLGAEHDQIYIYATDTPLSEEELKKLYGLGFFQPDVEDFVGPESYQPQDGWSAYV